MSQGADWSYDIGEAVHRLRRADGKVLGVVIVVSDAIHPEDGEYTPIVLNRAGGMARLPTAPLLGEAKAAVERGHGPR